MKRFIKLYVSAILLFLVCCCAALLFFYLVAVHTYLTMGTLFVLVILTAIAGHTIEYMNKTKTPTDGE